MPLLLVKQGRSLIHLAGRGVGVNGAFVRISPLLSGLLLTHVYKVSIVPDRAVPAWRILVCLFCICRSKISRHM
jgi:hypothetical protein